MSRINLKKDYEDGQVLYGDELNVNNSVTELGVNDNFEKIQELSTTKANKSYVDSLVSDKADAADTNNAISLLNAQKADKTELVRKADVTALNLKADITYVNTALSSKADKSDINYILAGLENMEELFLEPIAIELNTIKTNIGDMSKLRTTDKSSLVNAINSIQSEVIPIATSERAGLVKPDGVTTTVDLDGTIHAVGGGGGGGTSDYDLLANKPTINEIEIKGDLSLSDLGLYSKSEISTLLNAKANASDVITQTQYDRIIEPAIEEKATQSDVNTALETKADKLTTYTITQVDELLDVAEEAEDAKLTAKADKSTTYTKTQVDEAISAKADNLSFSNNQLQLKSGNDLIGTPVEITVGSNDVAIQPTEPTNPDNKLWIDTSEDEGVETVPSEVVDSMNGNQNDKAPTVRAVKNYCSNFETKGELLWTNPNPTADFSSQQITLSSSDWDLIEIYFIPNSNIGNAIDFTKAIAGRNPRLISADTTSIVSVRTMEYVNKTTYNVGVGIQGGQEQNRRNVPLYIVGYKTGLFS